jgi:ABC-type amino acid transport substrate-binding protein
MRFEQILATVIIALLAGTLGAFLVMAGTMPTNLLEAMPKILLENKLRCGYVEQPELLTRKDDKVSGAWGDLTESIARDAGWKIVWIEAETDSMAADLAAEKYDVLCSGFVPDIATAKTVSFSVPVFKQQARNATNYAMSAKNQALKVFLDQAVAIKRDQGALDEIIKAYPNAGLVPAAQ